MSKPLASLSLDLDNKWSYLKTHGDAGWEEFPSYFDVVVPHLLRVLDKLKLTITFFVVGQDAELDRNRNALQSIVAAGHEIGNHSFAHEPWLGAYSNDEINAELDQAEAAIEAVTGQRPRGFRGPGFSWSPQLIASLVDRGYAYDASTFPTFLGPVARAYYFMTSRLSKEERQRRRKLFGSVSDGLRPLKPFWWTTPQGRLMEIPVTTIPILRTPFHVSYLLYLRERSQAAANAYLSAALRMCKLRGVEPSVLLHPLDFLGGDDDGDLGFFPGMRQSGDEKRQYVTSVLAKLTERYDVLPMGQYADATAQNELVQRPIAKVLSRKSRSESDMTEHDVQSTDHRIPEVSTTTPVP